MTRGRSIDKTITPSRALTQQREYRARKANHTKHLEDENARLALENAALASQVRLLQQEVSQLRSGGSIERNAVEAAKEDVERALRRLSEIVGSSSHRRPPIHQQTPDSMVSPASNTTDKIQHRSLTPSHRKSCCSSSSKPPIPPPPSTTEIRPAATPIVSMVPIQPQQQHPPPFQPETVTIAQPQPQQAQTHISLQLASQIPSQLPFASPFPPSHMPYGQFEAFNRPPPANPQAAQDDSQGVPSYRTLFPQSSEREECCLGLISCDPCVLEEMETGM